MVFNKSGASECVAFGIKNAPVRGRKIILLAAIRRGRR